MSNPPEAVSGCLWGCAIGDAIGLPFEGLPPRRVARWLREPVGHQFCFRRGMVSDDTDHTIFTLQALMLAGDDPPQFARLLAGRLRCWLACLPAGIGLATLRSLLKSAAGFSPEESGVWSAGNGPAMRAAIIGVYHAANPELRVTCVRLSTRITHTDPKAEDGAQAVAAIASQIALEGDGPETPEALVQFLHPIRNHADWHETVERIKVACQQSDLTRACVHDPAVRGVSGYAYDSVPVAVTGWFLHRHDFRAAIESVVRLGGDTDTVAAIAGALVGTGVGEAGIPEHWRAGLSDFPHGPTRLNALVAGDRRATRFSWWLLPRGLAFTLLVLTHGFRRLLPPY